MMRYNAAIALFRHANKPHSIFLWTDYRSEERRVGKECGS